MKRLLIYIFLVIGTAAFSQNGKVDVPVIGIKVPLGETVSIEGIAIRFSEVTEDSRCPETVTCVWAGRVVINIEIKKTGESPLFKELTFGPESPARQGKKELYASESFSIFAIAVVPYPKTEGEVKEYNLILVKEPAG
jgi:hypothetical protein